MILYHPIEQLSVQADGALCCTVTFVPVTMPPPQICELELQKMRSQIEDVRQVALESHRRLAERNLSLHARMAELEASVLDHPALQVAVLLLAFLLGLLAGGV
jgi:hypothetical protein